MKGDALDDNIIDIIGLVIGVKSVNKFLKNLFEPPAPQFNVI